MRTERDRVARAARLLDGGLWRAVVEERWLLADAVALVFQIVDSLPPGVFIARGSHATN